VQGARRHWRKGLYEKESWNVSRRHHDVGSASGAPDIITGGQDPANLSGFGLAVERTP
jgi:hypothetical protein